MKKENHTNKKDELRKEYDFSKLGRGVKGKYSQKFKEGHNLVLLAPDVAKAFPDERSVNSALRSLIQERKTQATLSH